MEILSAHSRNQTGRNYGEQPERHSVLNGLYFFVLLFTVFFSGASQAAGLLRPVNTTETSLKIKSHHVTVIIENGYAITQVEQTFYNPNANDLEAEYMFPVPHKAIVGEFTYWIDGTPITAEIMEKKQAKQVYEQIKKQGREAALVTKNKAKTFNIKVTPVRAQQDVRIKLTYLQKTGINTSIGRYVYPLEDGGVDTLGTNFWSVNHSVETEFSFNLNLHSAYPVDQLRLPKHPNAKIAKHSDHNWAVNITSQNNATDNAEKNLEAEMAPANKTTRLNSTKNIPAKTNASELNTDILLYWRLQPGLPAGIDVISYKAPSQNTGTFMLTLTPGEDLAPITEGRDWIFILDYSGSMRLKYNSMIEGLRQGLNRLSPEDRFHLILFNNQSRDITTGFQSATPENVLAALNILSTHKPGGGTNLYKGLKKGLNRVDADRSSAIVLVTDGEANLGVTHKKDFLDLIKSRDVRLFTMVMGNSANKPLLKGMANISNGFALTVSNSDDIVGRLMEVTSRLTHEAMHDVTLNFSGVEVFDVTPQHIPSLYRGEQLTVFGRYRGEGTIDLTMNAKISGQPKKWETQFELPIQSTQHPELERLWAFSSIDNLQAQIDYLGEDADTAHAITDLALSYGLVTNYTSLIVLREEDFESQQISRNNAKRVAKEHAARQTRQQQHMQQKNSQHNTGKYQNQRNTPPMFQGPRASHGSGGGSFEYLTLFGLLGLLSLKHLSQKKAPK